MESRNLILAIAFSMVILVLWDQFYMAPQRKAMESQRQQAAEQTETVDGDLGTLSSGTGQGNDVLSREEALALAPGRVTIETPALTGSINLKGAVIDDLSLKYYHTTTDADSPIVTVLNPRETEFGHYIQTGVIARAGETAPLQDDRNAVWSAPDGAVLTPDSPVTLTRQEGPLTHEMTIAVDDLYMFTVTRKVTNNGTADAIVAPFGLAVQRGMPPFLKKFMILHEGPLGVLGQDGLKERKYQNVYKKDERVAENVSGGWVGLTSKNWLAAAIPNQDLVYSARLGHEPNTTRDKPVFISQYRGTQSQIAPGETYEYSGYMFGGAKRVDVLRGYEAAPEDGGLGIKDLDKAVDWGNFFFLTRPIFWLMHKFAELTGNYGVAILLLTLVIKAVLFPLANKSYKSMAGMRKVQPEMKKLQERYGDDKMKQQQEMMALYKKYNINPLAGCLPILMQMPIFYALYKTLFVTIEIRHEGFLYIKDLSAPDPAMIFNLFGLIPWDPASVPLLGQFLAIGLLPILMAIAMFFQTKLNPPPADPMQAKVFAFMPLIFLFIFAPFAAGLVLYWFWNTTLGVIQQYIIMKRNGADVDFFGNIRQTFGSGKSKPANDSK